MTKKKVLLKGPVCTVSGYGINTRLILNSLRYYEEYFDIYLESINWGNCGFLPYDDEERQYIDNLLVKTLQYNHMTSGHPQYDIFVHCTIPQEFEQRAPVNIGVTAGIESTKISPKWVEKTQLVDKVLVVSQHAKYGFDNSSYDARNEQTGEAIKDFKCQKPVVVINYPVDKAEPTSLDLGLTTSFNYLLVAQWGPRKNVDQVISWFVQENHNNERVGLVCKMNSANNSEVDIDFTRNRLQNLLNRFPNKKCKVYWVHGDMTESEMAGLYTHPNIHALISISPEGYGLSAFQAAYYGMPVITYGWGGYCDYMYMPVKLNSGRTRNKAMFAEVDYEIKPIPQEAVWGDILIKESSWAYPKEGSFKKILGEVRGSYEKYKEMALQLKAHIEEKFTKEKIYTQYATEIYGSAVKKVSVNDLPKVSVLMSVFKAKNYLDGCFKDLEKQTVFQDKCEAIVVHPKTSPEFDEEKAIIGAFVEKYPNNVKVLELEEDPGLYGCWNKALEMSSGEYITNWNSDDRRRADCIQACAKELFTDDNVGVVYFDQYITQKPNETFDNNTSGGKKYSFPEYSPDYVKVLNFTMHAMSCWRKSLHDKYGKFDDKYKSAGDWELANRWAVAGVKAKKLPDILGLYYFNPVGISTNPENFKWKQVEEREIYEKFKK